MPSKTTVYFFDALVPLYAELHGLKWCVKKGHSVPTKDLRGEECLACPAFVLNKGYCNPL